MRKTRILLTLLWRTSPTCARVSGAVDAGDPDSWHAPSVFWIFGGIDPNRYAKAKEADRLNEIPTNHNPRFAPVIHPTLETGVEELVVAARAWLAA